MKSAFLWLRKKLWMYTETLHTSFNYSHQEKRCFTKISACMGHLGENKKLNKAYWFLMQNFNTPERHQVSTHVTCAIFHEYWEWGWASSSPAAHTPGRQSSPHPGPAEGCSPSLEFFQALSSTPELEGAQVHLLPPSLFRWGQSHTDPPGLTLLPLQVPGETGPELT